MILGTRKYSPSGLGSLGDDWKYDGEQWWSNQKQAERFAVVQRRWNALLGLARASLAAWKAKAGPLDAHDLQVVERALRSSGIGGTADPMSAMLRLAGKYGPFSAVQQIKGIESSANNADIDIDKRERALRDLESPGQSRSSGGDSVQGGLRDGVWVFPKSSPEEERGVDQSQPGQASRFPFPDERSQEQSPFITFGDNPPSVKRIAFYLLLLTMVLGGVYVIDTVVSE